MPSNTCPCGRKELYSKCCGAVHKGQTLAGTAEDLMRSRYSAFTLANGDYLMQSHHSETRPVSEKKEIEKWAKSVSWLKLEVLATENGKQNDTIGSVEFKAYFMEKGSVNMIHENSFFKKENEKWVYWGAKEQ